MPLDSIEPHYITVSMSRDRQEIERAYTNDEEHACKDCCGHNVQYLQERTSHCSPDRHAHEKMADPLLNHSSGFYYRTSDLAAVFLLDDVKLSFVDG